MALFSKLNIHRIDVHFYAYESTLFLRKLPAALKNVSVNLAHLTHIKYKKMKLNFSLFVSALASPRVVNVEDHITRADQVLTGGFGTYLECPYGRVMRGTCTSGNDKESLN